MDPHVIRTFTMNRRGGVPVTIQVWQTYRQIPAEAGPGEWVPEEQPRFTTTEELEVAFGNSRMDLWIPATGEHLTWPDHDLTWWAWG